MSILVYWSCISIYFISNQILIFKQCNKGTCFMSLLPPKHLGESSLCPPSSPPTHTHSHTHTPTPLTPHTLHLPQLHTLTHSPLTPSQGTPLTHSHTHTLTHSHTHTLTHSHTHTLTHSHTHFYPL